MKKHNLVMAAVALCALAGAAQAQLSGSVGASTSLNFRGTELSNGNPSYGAGLGLKHASGLYGAASMATVSMPDRVTNARPDAWSQMRGTVTGGYGAVVSGVKLDAGYTYYGYAGSNDVKDYSFAEIHGGAEYMGFKAKLSRNVTAAQVNMPGYRVGDYYGEVGYSHRFGKATVGADAGYSWYNDKDAFVGVKDNLSVLRVHASYDLGHRVSLNAAYQAAGRDAYDRDHKQNEKVTVGVGYRF